MAGPEGAPRARERALEVRLRDRAKKKYREQFLRLLRKLCLGGNNRSVAAIQNEVPADDLIGTLKRRLDKAERPDPELTQQLVQLLTYHVTPTCFIWVRAPLWLRSAARRLIQA